MLLALVLVLARVVKVGVKRDGSAELLRAGPGAAPAPQVEITWIRHGLACHNTNDKYTTPKQWQHHWGKAKRSKLNVLDLGIKDGTSLLDPPLSNCGVQRSIEQGAAKHGVEYDWVGASALLRAIQTAVLEFPGQEVHVLPYISENGALDGANLQGPAQRATLAAWLSDHAATAQAAPASSLVGGRVDYGALQMETNKERDHVLQAARAKLGLTTREFMGFGDSMQDALRLLYEYVLPPLLDRKNTTDQRPLKLAIVSHSKFMGSDLPHCAAVLDVPARSKRDRKKPRNNEALAVTYTLHGDGKSGTLVPASCRLAYESRVNPAWLCARDVASCDGNVLVEDATLTRSFEQRVDFEQHAMYGSLAASEEVLYGNLASAEFCQRPHPGHCIGIAQAQVDDPLKQHAGLVIDTQQI